MKHKHYWHQPHIVWQGIKDGDSMISRYCTCGEIQIAHIRSDAWKKANKKTKIYPGVIEKCEESIASIKQDL